MPTGALGNDEQTKAPIDRMIPLMDADVSSDWVGGSVGACSAAVLDCSRYSGTTMTRVAELITEKALLSSGSICTAEDGNEGVGMNEMRLRTNSQQNAQASDPNGKSHVQGQNAYLIEKHPFGHFGIVLLLE